MWMNLQHLKAEIFLISKICCDIFQNSFREWQKNNQEIRLVEIFHGQQNEGKQQLEEWKMN